MRSFRLKHKKKFHPKHTDKVRHFSIHETIFRRKFFLILLYVTIILFSEEKSIALCVLSMVKSNLFKQKCLIMRTHRNICDLRRYRFGIPPFCQSASAVKRSAPAPKRRNRPLQKGRSEITYPLAEDRERTAGSCRDKYSVSNCRRKRRDEKESVNLDILANIPIKNRQVSSERRLIRY